MHLITTWFGTFLFDNTTIADKILWPKNVKKITKQLQQIEQNQILPEEKKLAKGKNIIVNERRLEPLGTYTTKEYFIKIISLEPESYGFTQDLFHEVSLSITKDKINTQLHSKDLQIIQMVNALDDLIQTANLLSERLHYWSCIPTPKEKIEPFKKTLDSVNQEMKRIEYQLAEDMRQCAPNICTIIGPLIGARLIASSGGLKHLAVMPASTIQLLGAEKALFRYKKEGGKPPKHGIIYQHHLINTSPREKRGKIARILAAKLTTAAKADAFTQRDISNLLLKELEKRIKDIRNE